MLADFPQSARLANIQCENCHGPQKTGAAHMDQPGEGTTTGETTDAPVRIEGKTPLLGPFGVRPFSWRRRQARGPGGLRLGGPRGSWKEVPRVSGREDMTW
jgi:hypothetical protein